MSENIVSAPTDAPAAAVENKSARKSELELARIVACCCIIVIHQIFTYSTLYPQGSFLRMLSKGCATTIFFMITGAFLSARHPFVKQIGRLATKNVIPFLVITPLILQFWPAMAGQIPFTDCFTQWNVSLRGFLTMLFSMRVDAIVSPHGYATPEGGIYHLWFTFALYKCYIFLPILKLFLVDGQAGEAVKRYALAAGAFFFLIVPTVKLLVAPDSMFARLPGIQLEPFLWLWVIMIGNHLYFHINQAALPGPTLRRLNLACAVAYIALMSVNYYITMHYALQADGTTAYDKFLERGFIPLFLANIAAFVFFVTLRIDGERISRWIRATANRVFYIYLFHVPVLAILRATVFKSLIYYRADIKLLVMVSVFAICYCIAGVCRRLERLVRGLLGQLSPEGLLPWLAAPPQSLRRFGKK